MRCRRESVLASDDPAVLDHALHADDTRVNRGNPAIAVLSIGYQSLGSCSRAAGWSAATLCAHRVISLLCSICVALGAKRTSTSLRYATGFYECAAQLAIATPSAPSVTRTKPCAT